MLFCAFWHLPFGIWGACYSAQKFCYFVYYRNILFILQFWHLPFCIWGVYHSAKKFCYFVYNRNILFILAFVICHLAFQWFYFAFYLIRSTYSNCEFWFNFLLGCIFSNYIMSFFIFLDVYLILSDFGYPGSLSFGCFDTFEWFGCLPHSGETSFCFTQFFFLSDSCDLFSLVTWVS